MRTLVVLLLLLNMAFFAGHYYFEWNYFAPRELQAGTTEETPLPPGALRLRLLREPELANKPAKVATTATPGQARGPKPESLAEHLQPKDAGEPTPPPVAKLPERCFSLGPMVDEKYLQLATRVLRKEEINAVERTEIEQVPVEFFVVVPAQPSMADSRKKVAELKQKGIDDLWLFLEGDRKGSISLGLYSRRAYAEKRVGELAEIGIEAVVEDRLKDQNVYWLDYSQRGKSGLSGRAWQELAKVPGLQTKRRSCSLVVGN